VVTTSAAEAGRLYDVVVRQILPEPSCGLLAAGQISKLAKSPEYCTISQPLPTSQKFPEHCHRRDCIHDLFVLVGSASEPFASIDDECGLFVTVPFYFVTLGKSRN
jgi:hypothetical protein